MKLTLTDAALTDAFGGGIKTGSVVVVDGRLGTGKTPLLLRLVHALARPAVFVSTSQAVAVLLAEAARIAPGSWSGTRFYALNAASTVLPCLAEPMPDVLAIDDIDAMLTTTLPDDVRELTARVVAHGAVLLVSSHAPSVTSVVCGAASDGNATVVYLVKTAADDTPSVSVWSTAIVPKPRLTKRPSSGAAQLYRTTVTYWSRFDPAQHNRDFFELFEWARTTGAAIAEVSEPVFAEAPTHVAALLLPATIPTLTPPSLPLQDSGPDAPKPQS